jgi:hypothetical protein
MTASEINAANAALHAELASATTPLPIDPAVAIGEALRELPEGDFDDLDFSEFDQQNYMELYDNRERNCMQWMRLIYHTRQGPAGTDSEIQLLYEVI